MVALNDQVSSPILLLPFVPKLVSSLYLTVAILQVRKTSQLLELI